MNYINDIDVFLEDNFTGYDALRHMYQNTSEWY